MKKNQLMKGKLALLISALLLAGAIAQAAPLGTAISYQGRLDDSGSPANGTYSFRFRLVSDAAGTTQIGPVVDMPNQTLADGLLNAPLEFGANAFTGDARWLEISVKTGGPSDPSQYLKLNPQPLPPAPASHFSRLAGNVLDGTITGAKLAPLAITTTHISDGAITAPKLGPASITSGNVADNAITAAKIASGQVVKSLNVKGNLLRDNVTLTEGANITLTPNGNTVTIASSGGGSGPWATLSGNTYYTGGNVGIGTTTPTVPLHVNSSATASSVLAALLEPSLVNNGFNQIYLGRTPSDNGCATFTYTHSEIVGTVGLSLGLYGKSYMLNLDGRGTVGIGAGSDLVLSGAETEGQLGVFRIYGHSRPDFPNPTARFIVQRNGNVGIGTPAPQAALEVKGSWDDGRPALQLGSPKPSIIFAGDSASGGRSWLIHNGGNGPGNLEFYDRAGSANWRPVMSLVDNSQFLRVDGGGGEAAYIGGDGLGNDVQVGSLNPSVTDIYMYNAGSQTHMHTHVGVLTIHGGADLAEPFPMKEESIEKGSVVIIDDEHPGHLKRSTRAYDTRVAGIVSGANGIKPGIALKQEGVLDQGENVALTGRVYVKADAAHGAIKPGDLLTTSDVPGHAMKVTDHAKSQGAILGKAMSALKEGTGLVLVLVTLQ